eukprot:m.164217 g.164217  ORF g.164217 m.164217 type:complete len:132 (-) comp12396_c0_seq1:135-530(-)
MKKNIKYPDRLSITCIAHDVTQSVQLATRSEYPIMSEEQFKKAVWLIRNGPKKDSSNEEKLSFYKYYKQATEGDVKGSQPWAVQMESRAKWDAWDSVKGMDKEEAMRLYVELIAKSDPDWEKNEALKDYSE